MVLTKLKQILLREMLEQMIHIYAKCAMYVERIPDIMTLNFLILHQI